MTKTFEQLQSELNNLQVCKAERELLVAKFNSDFWADQVAGLDMMIDSVKKEIKSLNRKQNISVYFEHGYKWTVSVDGQDESVATGLSKVDAMALARSIKKDFIGTTTINEQKLTKAEIVENMVALHEEGFTF